MTSATFELSAKYSINAISPPKNMDIATPASIIVVGLKCIFLLKININRAGNTPNPKANNIIAGLKAEPIVPNTIIDKHAPKDAPCDTPIVLGEAKGFPRQLCKILPHIPRVAPANIEHKTCGILSFQITMLILESFDVSPKITSIGFDEELLNNKSHKATTISNNKAIIT